MPSPTFERALKTMRTLLTGGLMNRVFGQGRANLKATQALALSAPAKLAVIAAIIALLVAGSMLALVSRAAARPLGEGEKAARGAGSTALPRSLGQGRLKKDEATL